jgi:hypothetical protein
MLDGYRGHRAPPYVAPITIGCCCVLGVEQPMRRRLDVRTRVTYCRTRSERRGATISRTNGRSKMLDTRHVEVAA